jgi:hypothetical protein
MIVPLLLKSGSKGSSTGDVSGAKRASSLKGNPIV